MVFNVVLSAVSVVAVVLLATVAALVAARVRTPGAPVSSVLTAWFPWFTLVVTAGDGTTVSSLLGGVLTAWFTMVVAAGDSTVTGDAARGWLVCRGVEALVGGPGDDSRGDGAAACDGARVDSSLSRNWNNSSADMDCTTSSSSYRDH